MEIPEGGNACKRDSPDDICCGLLPFNPAAGQFCCGGVVVDDPTGNTTKAPAYDTTSQVCLFGQTIGRLTPSGDVVYYCCGGNIAKLPVNKCHISDDNVLIGCCGLELYKKGMHDCCGNFVVPPLNSWMPRECTVPPAFDPNHQECVGGETFTYFDAYNCPEYTVSRNCFLLSFSLKFWFFSSLDYPGSVRWQHS
ncbi:hypothetical protein NP493_183g02016 [Ridgeia piscesae]|uniref:Uncharacterized protein n=1 Tax=Ridgeia piscesae TaxID=27915 RepID=A0AAD9UF34_RIDPI|nr:hypothetical protein NP493_183g02016 [Ridgeia piscesae]